MQCPLCRDTQLQPRFAQGVEVDVCPRCRGLWLDRGELERLLDDGEGEAAPSPAPSRQRDEPPACRKKSKAKRLADLFEDVLDL